MCTMHTLERCFIVKKDVSRTVFLQILSGTFICTLVNCSVERLACITNRTNTHSVSPPIEQTTEYKLFSIHNILSALICVSALKIICRNNTLSYRCLRCANYKGTANLCDILVDHFTPLVVNDKADFLRAVFCLY